jgi:hypothetical protein
MAVDLSVQPFGLAVTEECSSIARDWQYAMATDMSSSIATSLSRNCDTAT